MGTRAPASRSLWTPSEVRRVDDDAVDRLGGQRLGDRQGVADEDAVGRKRLHGSLRLSVLGITVSLVDASTWANVIAGLALLVAVATLVWSRVDVRAARRSAADADARADRATRAAEESARAHREIADATPKPTVDWQLVDRDKKGLELIQVGSLVAREIEIACPECTRLDVLTEIPDVMRSGESVRLVHLQAWGEGPPVLVVSWRDDSSVERQRWRRPL